MKVYSCVKEFELQCIVSCLIIVVNYVLVSLIPMLHSTARGNHHPDFVSNNNELKDMITSNEILYMHTDSRAVSDVSNINIIIPEKTGYKHYQ